MINTTYLLTSLRKGDINIVTEEKNQLAAEKDHTARLVMRSIEGSHIFARKVESSFV